MKIDLKKTFGKANSIVQEFLHGKQKLFAKGEACYVRGKYSECIKKLELFLHYNSGEQNSTKQNSDKANIREQRALVLLGRAYSISSQTIKARQTFALVLDGYVKTNYQASDKVGLLNFFELDATIKLCELLCKELEENKAITFSNLLLHQDSIPAAHTVNFVELLNQFTKIAIYKNSWTLAEKLNSKALSLDAKNQLSKLYQGKISIYKAQYNKAEQLFRDNLSKISTHTLTFYSSYITTLEKLSKFKEAELELEKFKEKIDGLNLEPFALAHFWLEQEEFLLAKAIFETLSKNSSTNDKAKCLPAIYLCNKELTENHDKQSTLDALNLILKSSSKNAHSQIIKTALNECSHLSQRNLAWRIAQNFIRTNERDKELLTEAIILARNFGNFELAESWAQQALKTKSTFDKFTQIKSLLDGELRVYRAKYRPKLYWTQPKYWEAGKNKVLHVLETSLPYKLDGYSFRSHAVLKMQQKLGWIVSAVTRPGFPRDVGRVNNSHSTVFDSVLYYRIKADGEAHYFKRSLDQYLDAYAHRLLQISIREQPEIIHAVSNFKNAVAAKAVSDALKIPWVYEMRGVWEESLVSRRIISGNSERFEYVRNLEDEYLQLASAVTTMSKSMKVHLMDRSIPGDKIFIVPHGVDTEQFAPRNKNQKLIDDLNLHADYIFGYVGSVLRYEGLDYLLKAAKYYKENYSDNFVCLIVGSGYDLPRLHRITRQLQLQDNVRLTGAVPHKLVSDYYNLLDVFVLPRNSDPICHIETPVKPFEAMSCGKPLILSATKALNEIANNGKFGLTFQPETFEDLGEKLKLLNSSIARKELSQYSRNYILEEHSWKIVVEKYKSVYEYALGNSQVHNKAA